MPSTLKTVETIYSVLPPPAGPVFAATFKFLDFVGYFGNADPVTQAIKLFEREIAAIKKDLETLKARVNQLAERVAQNENKNRLNRLTDIRLRLESLINRIAHQPASVSERDALAFDAGQLADIFIDELDLWRWTDVETTRLLDDYGHEAEPPQVNLLEPDFKSLLAQPIYAMAILTWIAAIDLDSGGNVHVVQQKYGVRLRRHINQNRVRDGFDDMRQAPETLPENVMTRVICRPVAQHKYALDGECLISIQCENTMQRKIFAVRDVVLPMPAGSEIACVAPGKLGELDEREIEGLQGSETFRQLADLLERVLLTGSLRQQFIGRFGSSPTRGVAFVYAIDQNGNLFWFRQAANADPAAPGVWEGPKKAGAGWQGFNRVYPAGGNRFYGLNPDGDLVWYRHDGFNDGSLVWSGPTTVGSGWQNFKDIVSGSDGVLYAIQPDGIMYWYKHLGFRDGAAGHWVERRQVGVGWQGFKSVCSAGEGVLYAIADDGSLIWYRHDGFADGSANWRGPTTVGSGWGNFREVFAVSDGVIFAVQPGGDVFWYRHLDWQTGGRNWQGPVAAAYGFGGYRQLFPLMPATPDPIR